MLLLLLGVLVLFIALSFAASSISGAAKGVDGLRGFFDRLNAKMDAKLAERRKQKP
jgi:hypothetical protein